MNPEQIEQRVLAVLESEPAVQVATLFGSVARGRVGPDSDVDVGVAVGERGLSAELKIALIERIAEAVGRAVDIVDLWEATSVSLKEALASGRLLLCRDRALYARLIQRLIYDQADMEPYRERLLRKRRRAWLDR